MPDAAKAELLRALGRLVRGLSMLFWGLPMCIVFYVQTARTDWLEFLGAWAFVPATVLSGTIIYAFSQLRHFQKQERVWLHAINRAEGFALINTGLSPFLFWWRRFPFVPLYGWCIGVLIFSCLLLLVEVNRVLRGLSAMLPDESLREETKLFVSFDIPLLLTVFFGLACFFALEQIDYLPRIAAQVMMALEQRGIWLVFFLALIPFAMTLALIWKIKETIFAAIINAER